MYPIVGIGKWAYANSECWACWWQLASCLTIHSNRSSPVARCWGRSHLTLYQKWPGSTCWSLFLIIEGKELQLLKMLRQQESKKKTTKNFAKPNSTNPPAASFPFTVISCFPLHSRATSESQSHLAMQTAHHCAALSPRLKKKFCVIMLIQRVPSPQPLRGLDWLNSVHRTFP